MPIEMAIKSFGLGTRSGGHSFRRADYECELLLTCWGTLRCRIGQDTDYSAATLHLSFGICLALRDQMVAGNQKLF
jgi:hypothetical protein